MPYILTLINTIMEDTYVDGRWNWWGLLDIEPEEEQEENDTNNK